jgi:hypothetical protein
MDRDRTAYPSLGNYRITLPKSIKNVCSVKLVTAIIPSITSENFIALDIPELQTNNLFNSANDTVYNSSVILPITDPENSTGMININCSYLNHIRHEYTNYINIDKLTIGLKKLDGSYYSFGNDTSPPTAPTTNLQNYFVFCVEYLQKDIFRTNPIF